MLEWTPSLTRWAQEDEAVNCSNKGPAPNSSMEQTARRAAPSSPQHIEIPLGCASMGESNEPVV
jgi:hypothetical protein